MNLDDSIWDSYWHARHAYHAGDIKSAEHLYRRLRAEHSIELFYEVALCAPVKFVHPLASVLGRAQYAPHLVIYQGVSIGSTVDHERPTFTGPCVLFPHSGVIGPVTVGANVWITAGTIVQAFPGKPTHIPDNMLVYHRSDKTHGFRYTDRSVINTFFPAATP